MDRELEYTLKLIVNTFPKMDIVRVLVEKKKPLSETELAQMSHHSLSEARISLADLVNVKAVNAVMLDGSLHYQVLPGSPSFKILSKLSHLYNGNGRTEINQRLHDFHISESIRAILAASDQLYSGDIKVETRNGVVYLSGSVNTPRELEIIGTVIHPFKGRLFYQRLKNQLAVRPGYHPLDNQLRDMVVQSLMRKGEEFFREVGTRLFSRLEVNVMNRVAYIEALCDEQQKRHMLSCTTFEVKGLAHIVNHSVIGVTMDEGLKWEG